MLRNFKHLSLYALAAVIVAAGLVAGGCKKSSDDPNALKAAFSWKADAVAVNKITFTNESKNATTYVWSFGDGGTSSDASPTHIYAAAGTFTVKLVVTGDTKVDSVSKSVKVDKVASTVPSTVEELEALLKAKRWQPVHIFDTDESGFIEHTESCYKDDTLRFFANTNASMSTGDKACEGQVAHDTYPMLWQAYISSTAGGDIPRLTVTGIIRFYIIGEIKQLDGNTLKIEMTHSLTGETAITEFKAVK